MRQMVVQAAKRYKPRELEEKIEAFWKERDAYHAAKRHREKGEEFYFVDGPPYTSGNIHLGTAWNKILKDAAIRYYRMQGYNVRDQPGYDMHGLPIEVLVEKDLGIENKQQIEVQGVQKFVSKCRDFAMKNRDNMTRQFRRLGVWMDWDHPYMTVENHYINAAWWMLKKAEEEGMLFRDLRVLSWCPRCETALAEAELEYWDEEDPSVYVKFPTKRYPNEYIIIWTTTPWTLTANLAAAVHPEYEYVRVLADRDGKEEIYIMLGETHEKVLEEAGVNEFMIIETLPGVALSGIPYETPLKDDISWPEGLGEWAHKIILFDSVEADKSGIVHIAPGYGPEDFELGKEFDLPPFCPVGRNGRLGKECGKYAGVPVREANGRIISLLKDRGLMLHDGVEKHRYGHCWRCKTPIIYKTTKQWFLRVTAKKERMLEEVDRIKWTPEWMGTSRQRKWVENSRDWCISRQRYWGIPLPIWECECGNTVVVGSSEELKDAVGYKEGMDLHRPWVDKVKLTCSECGKMMDRVEDVLDVWVDSAVCSWAQLKYPLEEEEFKRWWPVRWITEGHDQTRGWFYSQLAAGVIAFDRAPYDSVLTHGFTLDKEGRPMSKSLGNVVDPMEVIEKYGVDPLRMYILGASAPWEDLVYSEEEIRSTAKTLNILWNVYYFATTYMTLDGHSYARHNISTLREKMEVEDKWLLSRLESLKREVDQGWKTYEIHKMVRAIQRFIVDDLSRWYVKIIRDRIWVEGSAVTKHAAYATLHHVLLTTARLLAPITPYIAEEIYQNLEGRHATVHMTDWPKSDPSWMNPALEKQMARVEKVVEALSNVRQKAGVKLRWPLGRAVIKADEETLEAVKTLEKIVKAQANIKRLEYLPLDKEWDELIVEVEPNLDAIGPVFRQWSSRIAILLKAQDPHRIKEKMEHGEYVLGIEGQRVTITPEMLSFTTRLPENVYESKFDHGTIYLDANMSDELLSEAYAREVIRRIQQMRKELDLEVDSFIETRLTTSDRLYDLLIGWAEHIAEETRSQVLEFVDDVPEEGYVVEWNIEGEDVYISVIPLVIEYEEEEPAEAAAQPQGRQPSPAPASGAPGVPGGTAPPQTGVSPGGILPSGPATGEATAGGGTGGSPGGEEARPKTVETIQLSPEEQRERIREVLTSITGIKEKKAKSIMDSGFDTFEAFKAADVKDLSALKGVSKSMAKKILHKMEEYFKENEEKEEEKYSCPVCGAQVDEDTEKCPRCGTVLLEPEPKKALLKKGKKLEEIEVRGGFTYLVCGDKGGREKAYGLLSGEKEKGRKCLCITREYPDKIEEEYGLKDVPIIWLSDVGKKNSIRPKNLEKLNFAVEQFLLKNSGGVVLLDGIEYLVTNNTFISVLRLVQAIKDQAAVSGATVIVPVDVDSLEEHQIKLLEKEMDETV
ncbi:MAG: isoleucine--tRNA ligase [Thermoplasmata archaeon]|nr:isoleucine--tRNA ligase [Thermoplasmata archaeon]